MMRADTFGVGRGTLFGNMDISNAIVDGILFILQLWTLVKQSFENKRRQRALLRGPFCEQRPCVHLG